MIVGYKHSERRWTELDMSCLYLSIDDRGKKEQDDIDDSLFLHLVGSTFGPFAKESQVKLIKATPMHPAAFKGYAEGFIA